MNAMVWEAGRTPLYGRWRTLGECGCSQLAGGEEEDHDDANEIFDGVNDGNEGELGMESRRFYHLVKKEHSSFFEEVSFGQEWVLKQQNPAK